MRIDLYAATLAAVVQASGTVQLFDQGLTGQFLCPVEIFN